ncbi:protein mono-ADP-ribosyltransferase PARP3-like [Mya arenaria]|uniref:protein mono-ADP-ribosyltransferase PARP3-like n=1 Tax=Mya arenaria TaxID=6604 RepID=UPI0022DEF460|nr:protein mono-ADP-ribosyltransferase PARP3-like [Mya arenaria]
MPPKRKAAGKAKGAGGKKAKVEEAPAAPKTLKDAAAALKAVDKKVGGKKTHKVDSFVPFASNYSVVDDFDCMLNQTNIGHNNNKFYVIQMLQNGTDYYNWTRWGRVGESGANSMNLASTKDAAIKDFEKKFRDKTKNKWADRKDFKPCAGKYALIEMADEDEDEVDAPVMAAPSAANKKVAAPKLDRNTQNLLKLIFDNDMFRDTMKKFDIDVKKMPLGKLSKGQIAKGFDVLDDIEKELNANRRNKLAELSSKFYTVIPHDFGRKVPPVISDLESLRSKMDMLLVLGDIEVALSLQKEKDKKMTETKGDLLPNPMDINYGLLNCELEYLDKKSPEFKVIETYTNNTGGGWRQAKIREVFKVCRDGESSRFAAHDKITNRKLLWHGTSVAVVAAILKGGLRIMPHSGGRVGSGIYFASENSKSSSYVGTVGTKGIMFLNEVALGKEHHVDTNQSHLKAAPAGYDCVIAQGNTEPDPKKNTTLTFDGKKVVVPQGKPIPNPKWGHSHFGQSEYLVYKESQNRIRYLLLMDF